MTLAYKAGAGLTTPFSLSMTGTHRTCKFLQGIDGHTLSASASRDYQTTKPRIECPQVPVMSTAYVTLPSRTHHRGAVRHPAWNGLGTSVLKGVPQDHF